MKYSEVNILSTRPLDQQLIQTAAENHVMIDCMDFIKTEPIDSEGLKDRISGLSSEIQTVVFTSMNAVETVAGILSGKKPDWRIFCLGTATKELVNTYFPANSIAGTAKNAASLAKEIIDKDVKDVIFFCGDHRRDELPEILSLQNISVEEIVVYKSSLTPKKILKRYDGILFFSPTAVKSFVSVNSILPGVVLFAIGTTTAECIRQHCSNKILISDLPGKRNLVEKAIFHFSKTNLSNERIKE